MRRNKLLNTVIQITSNGLSEKVRVGIVGGMADIIQTQVKAEKVITI